MTLSLRDQMLDVKLEAAEHRTARILEADRETLTELLRSAGYALDGMTVQVSSPEKPVQGFKAMAGQGGNGQPRPGRSPRRAARSRMPSVVRAPDAAMTMGLLRRQAMEEIMRRAALLLTAIFISSTAWASPRRDVGATGGCANGDDPGGPQIQRAAGDALRRRPHRGRGERARSSLMR